MSIEKLAVECGLIFPPLETESKNKDDWFIEKLEAFAKAYAQQQSEPKKQSWPNHNWCVGCDPDNCSGCGIEPIERRKQQNEPLLSIQIMENTLYRDSIVRISKEKLPNGTYKLYTTPPASGWAKVIDEALATRHLGVMNLDDTYDEAKAKLDMLLSWEVDVATDEKVNGGKRLVDAAEYDSLAECKGCGGTDIEGNYFRVCTGACKGG